jgi:hypothetical protein
MNGESSIIEMAMLLQKVIQFVYSFTGLSLMVGGYIILLGFPAVAYVVSYRMYSADSQQQKSSLVSGAMAHAKASGMALVTVVLSTLIFAFIFKSIIGLDDSIEKIVADVLNINEAFG